MKNILTAVVALVIVVAIIAVMGAGATGQSNDQFLRIHIRADSNSEEAQAVKYVVKQAVVEYLTPYIAQADSKNSAQQIVANHLEGIESVADKVLMANGFDYKCTAKVCQESFPTRTYDGLTLQSGVYDALILELGSGEGDNWWCVVYPPLCFVNGESNGTNSIVYRSKLLEIIEQWKSLLGIN